MRSWTVSPGDGQDYTSLEALGVQVELNGKNVVYYPPKKAEKLKEFITSVVGSQEPRDTNTPQAIERMTVESLLGKEKWVAHVHPRLSPLLRSSYALLRATVARGGKRSRKRLRVSPSAAFVADP